MLLETSQHTSNHFAGGKSPPHHLTLASHANVRSQQRRETLLLRYTLVSRCISIIALPHCYWVCSVVLCALWMLQRSMKWNVYSGNIGFTQCMQPLAARLQHQHPAQILIKSLFAVTAGNTCKACTSCSCWSECRFRTYCLSGLYPPPLMSKSSRLVYTCCQQLLQELAYE